MFIQKHSVNWNDELVLVLEGYIGSTGEITHTNVSTILRLSIEEIGNIYDQLLAQGESPAASIRLTIKDRLCIFPLRMATELIRIVAQVWCDYEFGDQTEYLPQEECTEEYLLSL